jgi:hypothetical protein
MGTNKRRYLSLVDKSRCEFTGLVDPKLKALLDGNLLHLSLTHCAVKELSILSSQGQFRQTGRCL